MKSYKLKEGDMIWRLLKPSTLHMINFKTDRKGMEIGSLESYTYITNDKHFKTKTILSNLIRTMYER